MWTRRSLGHHLLHPLIQIPNAFPAIEQKVKSGWDKGWPDKVVKYYFTNVLIPAYKSMIKNQTYLLSITTQWKEDSISGSLLHNVQFDEKKIPTKDQSQKCFLEKWELSSINKFFCFASKLDFIIHSKLPKDF